MNGSAKKEAIKQRLEWLARDGRITAEAVVEDARDEASPLHAEFEWDDSKASHQWRIRQARALIVSVRIEVAHEHRVLSTVAYVRDPDAATQEQGYVRTVDLQSDEDRARRALLNEAGQIEARLRRARDLAAVLGMEAELETILDQFVALQKKLKAA